MEQNSQYWINRLNLEPHPEGGFYKRTEVVEGNPRNLATTIYYLLEKGDVSRIHKFDANEFWIFHAGGTAKLFTFEENITSTSIGQKGELKCLIPANTWMGMELAEGDFILVSCVVVPGFEFATHEMGDQKTFLEKYPNDSDLIQRLTETE